MNPPLKLTYSEKLNKLEKEYEILLVRDPTLLSVFFRKYVSLV